MSYVNTGRWIVGRLRQVAVDGEGNRAPTGIYKPNVISDPDYISPINNEESQEACPVPTTTTTTTTTTSTSTTSTTTEPPATTTTTTEPPPTTTTTSTTTSTTTTSTTTTTTGAPATLDYIINEISDPYVDANLQIKVNSIVVVDEFVSGSGSISMAAGLPLSIEALCGTTSLAPNAKFTLRVLRNGVEIFPFEEEDAVSGNNLLSSDTILAGAHYEVFVTTSADTAVDCGNSSSYSGGESFPTEQVVNLGSSLGDVLIPFDAISIPDKFEFWFDGVKVADSGYRGSTSYQSSLDAALASRGLPPETIISGGSGTMSFNKGTATTTGIMKIFAPLSGTAWNYTVNCPTPTTTTTTAAPENGEVSLVNPPDSPYVIESAGGDGTDMPNMLHVNIGANDSVDYPYTGTIPIQNVYAILTGDFTPDWVIEFRVNGAIICTQSITGADTYYCTLPDDLVAPDNLTIAIIYSP